MAGISSQQGLDEVTSLLDTMRVGSTFDWERFLGTEEKRRDLTRPTDLLDAVLQRMGYQIVALPQNSRRRPKRGRAADAVHPVGGTDPQGDTAPRRRGRPRKDQATGEELAS